MKDKLYQGEKSLKSAMDAYKAPLDKKAFEQFSASLDKNVKNNVSAPSPTLWNRFSLNGFLTILFLVISLYGLFHYRSIDGIKRTGSKDFVQESQNKVFAVEAENREMKRIKSDQGVKSNLVNLPDLSINNRKQGRQFERQAKDQNASKDVVRNSSKLHKSALKFNSETAQRESSGLTLNTETNPPARIGTELGENYQSKISAIGNFSSAVLEMRPPQTSGPTESEFLIKPSVERDILKPLVSIRGLKVNLMNYDVEKNDLGTIRLKPLVDKYNSHFYVGIEGGLARDINYSSQDTYFEQVSFADVAGMGYHLRMRAGYQYNRYTALEMNVHMRDISLSWDLSQGLYEPFDTKIQNSPVLGLRLVNRVPVFNRFSINTSLGYALGFNISAFNTERNGILIEPQNGQTEQIIFDYEYGNSASRTYQLLEAGVGLEYELNDQFSLTGSLNYFIGLDNLLANRIDYIAGEGNPGSFEIASKGGFYSVDVGLNYRFREMK